jgi:hypothetical protein
MPPAESHSALPSSDVRLLNESRYSTVFVQTDAPRHCDLSLQGRLDAIEMCGGKRNFAAAAPHWLSA